MAVLWGMAHIGALAQTTTTTKTTTVTESEPSTLNEAIVTATRASIKTPVAQTTIRGDEIRKMNIGADIPFIMELSPSVVISSESGLGLGNTSFRVRGTDPSRINVTIDGIPVNDAESQTVYWVNMPDFASSVNSIQIQRGVGTSSNGAAAFGATVNMQTTLPSVVPYAEVSTSAGMYNTFRHMIKAGTGNIGKGFTFDTRYSTVTSDGYIERSGARHKSFYIAGAWQGNNTFVKASILYGEQHTRLSWNGVPGYAIDSVRYPYFEAGVQGFHPGINRRYNPAGEYLDNNGKIAYYDNQSDNYTQTHYHLQLSQQLADKWLAHATLHLTRGEGFYEEYRLNRKLVEYGMNNIVVDGKTIKKSDLVRQKWMDNYFYGLTFAVNYTSNKLQWIIGGAGNRYDGNHFGKVLWVRYNINNDPKREWYRNNGTKDDYNLYTKATWQANEWLNLYADVQYRHIGYVMEGIDDDILPLDQSHYFNFFNPKAGAFFNINEKNTAYASFSVANREPTRADFKDVYKLGQNTMPKPERLCNAEVGYKFNNQWATLGINVYYMYYKDQLIASGRLNDVGYPLMENVEKSYRTGIELIGGAQIAQRLRIEANVTLSRNKIKNFTAYTDLYDNNVNWNELDQRIEHLGTTNLPFSPEVTGAALVRYTPLDNLSVSLISKYVGKQYYDNTSSRDHSLNAYLVNNFMVGYTFELYGVQCNLQGLVNNIFDKQFITSAWVYRAVFADGSPDYLENGFFPQAGRNVMAKLTLSF